MGLIRAIAAIVIFDGFRIKNLHDHFLFYFFKTTWKIFAGSILTCVISILKNEMQKTSGTGAELDAESASIPRTKKRCVHIPYTPAL